MLKNKLLQSLSASKVESVADAIDFDGTNDYQSRGSDLVGNADGKTFTFSAWVWMNSSASGTIYSAGDSNFEIDVTPSFLLISAAGALVATVPLLQTDVDMRTWYHVLISMDLTDTSKRSIYINDIAQSVTLTTYSNSNIDFTRTTHSIGAYSTGSQAWKGRLAHVFLAYEYIDLSLESNRRIFITADRKPA